MSKRESTTVPHDEVLKQSEFIKLIKNNNNGKLLKYSISTFGCQMNENDSERLMGMLSQMGYIEARSNQNSDIIIFNTCCVRENAELKVYGHLGALKSLKRKNPDIIIAVCGCMMQQRDVVEHIKKKYKHVDVIFGTHNLYKFPELIYTAQNLDKTIVDILDTEGFITEGLPLERKTSVKAFVTIMYGCNNYCSYCIVPYVRGRERSRNPQDIINEIKDLAIKGYKEITLLGQNVNSYGKEYTLDFAGLLSQINGINGIERIRFMTSHPKDLSNRLITAMKELDKVCGHIHLPIQSGSSKVLRDMNRKYSRDHYIELINKIREEIPGIAVTTDIIVGFPGETDEDFDQTLDAVSKISFDQAYTFLYSKRSGTPASKREDQIYEEAKKVRFEKLLSLQNKISKEINESYLGKEVEVLVEGLSKNSDKNYTGRTTTNKIVNFVGSNDMIGNIVKVKISQIQTWSLGGEVQK